MIAGTGKIILYQNILEKTEEKYPKDVEGNQPLSYAAKHGHFEVFNFIFDTLEDKNPEDNDGVTPFHRAAQASNCASA